jgi:hypothetical protein
MRKYLFVLSLIIISINAWGMNYSLMYGGQRKYHALSSTEIISSLIEGFNKVI